jgi:hypothetical protein
MKPIRRRNDVLSNGLSLVFAVAPRFHDVRRRMKLKPGT